MSDSSAPVPPAAPAVPPPYDPALSRKKAVSALVHGLATVLGVAFMTWVGDAEHLKAIIALLPLKYALAGGIIAPMLSGFAKNWIQHHQQ